MGKYLKIVCQQASACGSYVRLENNIEPRYYFFFTR